MTPGLPEASLDASRATPARILVVEDERIVARDLASALTDLGYSVPATVATGEDAISRARDLRPDLVLMDIRLAGAIDGVQAASSVRQDQDIPVIYLTAHSDDETLRRAMQTEPVGYLVKPFSTPQLRCAIEIALNRREINTRLHQRHEWLASTLRSVGEADGSDNRGTNASCLSAVAEALAGCGRGEPELEPRVAERIADLEAANRELESFMYGIANDLREPLKGIDGLSQSLIEDHAANLGPDGLNTLRQVRDTAARVRHVIDDLLLLSIDDLLLQSGVHKTVPQKDTVDLSRIARDIMACLREAAPDRTVKAVIERDIRVDGDAALLRVALENLLGNAWKSTGDVEHARIEFGAFDQDGTQVCFVRDNGAGIDMQHVNGLLDAFQLLDSADPFEGFGLAIVQRVIDKHGGRVWAEGAVGQGSTFYFAL
jgi:signal transduction histidine kinase